MSKHLIRLSAAFVALASIFALHTPSLALAQENPTIVDTVVAASPIASVAKAIAQPFNISAIGFDVFQYAAYFISYIVSLIGFILFGVTALFLQLVLNLNFTIVNSLSVQFGFSIVLAFANIFFVAAVIVMAVATIIRYDTYGAKQLLWKIVIAAVGVNFSLILAGTVINFADQGTKFFMNAAVPQLSASEAWDSGKFVDNLAGAFNPQRMMIASGIETSTNTGDKIKVRLQNRASQAGGVLAALTGMMMTAAMVVLMVIFLGTLLAAFLFRYVMLILLLTIMPVVWLAWIFPFGKGLVSWWRDRFVKYTFFAPMAMFFLYLSMRSVAFLNSAHDIGQGGVVDGTPTLGSNTGIGGFLEASLGNLASPVLNNAFNFILVAGTLYGGLYYSSKLGVRAVGAGESAMKSFGNTVKRRAINTGTRTLDKIRTSGKDEKGDTRLQRVSARLMKVGENNKLVSNTVGVATRAIARPIAAAGKPDKKRYEDRIKEYESSFKNLSTEALLKERERTASGSLMPNADYEAALFNELKERKKLGDLAKPMSPEVARDLEAYKKKTPNATKAELKSKEKQLREDYATEEKAYKDNFSKQFSRLTDSGVIKDVKSAAPRIAALMKPEKTKDKLRDQTINESIAAAVGSVKTDEDSIKAIVNDSDLFSITESGRLAVLATLELKGAHAKKFADMNAETTNNLKETLRFISERLNPDHAEFKDYFYDTSAPEWATMTSDEIKEATKDKVSLSVAKARFKALYGALKNVNALAAEDDAKNERSSPQPFINLSPATSKPPRSKTVFS